MAVRALRETRPDPIVYRRIVVPLEDDGESELGVALAAELAPEKGAAITALAMTSDARRVAWGDEDGNAGVVEIE